MADERYNDAWAAYFMGQGCHVVKVNARSGAGLKQISAVVQEACKEKIERDRKRGILNRPVRAMVAGIPNVGKSTFINSFAGKACAKTGNKPGVTKGNQWIRLNKSLELLDTPGILWPKFEDQTAGMKLAFIGSINDNILNTEELAARLILFLAQDYPGRLEERYGISFEDLDIKDISGGYVILEKIAKARGCLLKGSAYDTAKAAVLLLDDFRSCRLGRITLEFPPDKKETDMARKLTEEKLQAELERLEKMKEYENAYSACSAICGIDEAGRGPLAGPVAAAAVILPRDCQILFLNDSKKLSEETGRTFSGDQRKSGFPMA